MRGRREKRMKGKERQRKGGRWRERFDIRKCGIDAGREGRKNGKRRRERECQ